MAKTEAGKQFLKSLGVAFYETNAANTFGEAVTKSLSSDELAKANVSIIDLKDTVDKSGAKELLAKYAHRLPQAEVAQCSGCGTIKHTKQSLASGTCSNCGGKVVMPREGAQDAAKEKEHADEEDGRHTLPGGQLLKSFSKLEEEPYELPSGSPLRGNGALTGSVKSHGFHVQSAKGGNTTRINVLVHKDHPVGAASPAVSAGVQGKFLPLETKAAIGREVAKQNPHLSSVEWGVDPGTAISKARMWDKDRMATSVGLVSVGKTKSKPTAEEIHARQMAKIDAALAARPVTKSLTATGRFETFFMSEDLEKAKPKLGSGKRFHEIEEKAKEEGEDDPAAVAAAIGRKKYGAKKMAAMASKGRKLHTHKAINFYLDKLEKGFSSDKEPAYYYKNSGQAVCPDCASRDDYERPAEDDSPAKCDVRSKIVGNIRKSLGATRFEDELRKSPRRKYSHPWDKYPGMPPEIVDGWKQLTGKTASGPDPMKSKSGITEDGKMHNWTDPNHPLHAAKIAFDWQQGFTKTSRYGDTKYNQHSQVHKERLAALGADSGTKRKAEIQENALRGAQSYMENQKKYGGFHTPHPAISVARGQHMESSVGRSHMTHEEVNHATEALRAHPQYAHMGDEVHHRLENFENFHEDAADAHEQKHGSTEGYHADATNIHPQLLSHLNSALGDSKNASHVSAYNVIHAAHMATKAHPAIGALTTDNRKKEV